MLMLADTKQVVQPPTHLTTASTGCAAVAVVAVVSGVAAASVSVVVVVFDAIIVTSLDLSERRYGTAFRHGGVKKNASSAPCGLLPMQVVARENCSQF